MGETKMLNENGVTNLETALIAFAMVLVGGIAILLVFGGIVTNAITTIVNVL